VRDEALARIGGIRALPGRGVNDRIASAGRGRVVLGIEDIVAVDDIETNNLVAFGQQILHHSATDQAAASAHQYAHVYPFAADRHQSL
jgi:hypothetical protein